MAAVIRYLSDDNHAADSPLFNSLGTGPQSATMSLLWGAAFDTSVWSVSILYFCIYSMIIVCVPECVCMCAQLL